MAVYIVDPTTFKDGIKACRFGSEVKLASSYLVAPSVLDFANSFKYYVLSACAIVHVSDIVYKKWGIICTTRGKHPLNDHRPFSIPGCA